MDANEQAKWAAFEELEVHEFRDAVDDVMDSLLELLVQKRLDYGPRNLTEFGDSGILIRTNDKLARLKHRWRQGEDTAILGESGIDAWRDIAGYALLMLVAERVRPEAEKVGPDIAKDEVIAISMDDIALAMQTGVIRDPDELFNKLSQAAVAGGVPGVRRAMGEIGEAARRRQGEDAFSDADPESDEQAEAGDPTSGVLLEPPVMRRLDDEGPIKRVQLSETGEVEGVTAYPSDLEAGPDIAGEDG